jgi:two-component system response regulator WspF
MRVAIVNDLSLAREILRRLVLSVPGYTIAWTAENGEEAVEKARKDRPDAILMDLVMPVLDGVEATRRIMAQSPCPILLVTSTVTGNFNLVFRAMGFGGLDAVNTPTLGPGGTIRDGEGLLDRLAKLERLKARETRKPANQEAVAGLASPAPSLPVTLSGTQAATVCPIVALGASTGGPEALAVILKALPAHFPAAVIVIQHIAADFAPGLAGWLQGQCSLPVRPAVNGDEPRAGTVLLAATNDHLVLRPDRRLSYEREPADYPYRPSVDEFFHSLAEQWSRPGVAVLLTGMGNDGAQGLLALRRRGWHTVAQDQATSVVYGMPRVAADLGAACQVLPLNQISRAILACG